MTEEEPLMAIGVRGTGSFLPERIVTNRELESIVDTSDEWIVAHTGIRQRRWAEPGTVSSDLGTRAARRALEDATIAAEHVDGLVVATSSPDYIQPPTACVLHGKLGLDPVPAYDVSAVCAGFVYALANVAGLMTAFPRYGRMLVVGCEAYSGILDHRDRTTCVFFGDGAGAVLLDHVPDGYGVLSAHLMADSSRLDVVGIPAGGLVEPATVDTVVGGGHYFRMDGPQVWEFAVHALPIAIKEALLGADLGIGDVDLLITHQANARMIEAVVAALGVPQSKVPTTVDRYGNTAAASVPIVLDEVARAGRIRRGDTVVLAAVGGGMTAAAVVLRWY
jgi:3-oxoacyl-[acyl-carrier-protein] synthase-3